MSEATAGGQLTESRRQSAVHSSTKALGLVSTLKLALVSYASGENGAKETAGQILHEDLNIKNV